MFQAWIFIAETSATAGAPSNSDIATPFYYKGDFWISTLLGIAGIIFSVLAFIEAKQAKKAAVAAGKTVKLQTIVIELSEISQRLEGIEPNLDYGYARELLNDASRRLNRHLAAIQDDEDVHEVITEIFELIEAARPVLASVRPTTQAPVNTAVPFQYSPAFNAMESHFSAISGKVGVLTGLLEKRTIEPHEQ